MAVEDVSAFDHAIGKPNVRPLVIEASVPSERRRHSSLDVALLAVRSFRVGRTDLLAGGGTRVTGQAILPQLERVRHDRRCVLVRALAVQPVGTPPLERARHEQFVRLPKHVTLVAAAPVGQAAREGVRRGRREPDSRDRHATLGVTMDAANAEGLVRNDGRRAFVGASLRAYGCAGLGRPRNTRDLDLGRAPAVPTGRNERQQDPTFSIRAEHFL